MPANSKGIVRFYDIQEMVQAYYPDADVDLIQRAYVFSAQVHDGQIRASGEPYLVHPVAVACILAKMRLDESTVATGLLHDTVEDTLTTQDDLEHLFGKEISELVDGVTKISKMQFQSKEERQAENFRKMILAMSKDLRVLLVKLADRLHNMRTLTHMPPESQKKTACETADIYAPLASRLGIHWMWSELSDLAFRYLEPERYAQLSAKVEEYREEQEAFMNKVLHIIGDKLDHYGYHAVVKGRFKEVFSVHRKMVTQNLDFTQLHDLTAFRIILDEVSDCYAVLGYIHELWKPIPGRFKDYIAMPKLNMYQSLHTTVIGPDGHRIEIQIRTKEMDLVAEEGIAAHWSYKEGKAVQDKEAQVVSWLRDMMQAHEELEDPREFFENVRVDLYPDEVYVFTPKGDVKAFPRGATPLDFAYGIHTQVGHTCVGARVNNRMVPLKYQLQTGDTVEIVTSVHQRPHKDWLKFVKTGRARTKIRHYVLQEERERSIEMGREGTERELKKWRLDLSRVEKEGEILKIAQEFSFKTDKDLYAAIGYGRISPKVIVTKLIPPHEREKAKTVMTEERLTKRERGMTKSGVRIQGLSDCMVNFAKCCNPLPGDPIKGFVTRGRGVTIHKQDCANLSAEDSIRIVDCTWDEDQNLRRMVRLGIQASDRSGLLATISGVFTSNDSDILQANIATVSNHMAQGTFSILVRNLEHLNRIIAALKSIKGMEKVERLGTGQWNPPGSQ